MLLHIRAFPKDLQEKLQSFPRHDPRVEQRFVTLLLKDGRRVRNVVIEVEEPVRLEECDSFDYSTISDVHRQVWDENEGEKDWWDPTNKEW